MSYLTIAGLKKRFRKHEVLRNINLQVEKGEFVCFLGASGCGKTTLLRIIAGLERADAGEIVVDGRDISRLRPSGRNLSMVFQSYALFPNMTAFQNVEYGLRKKIKDKEKRRDLVMEMLTLMGLLDVEKKYPDQMSGGQQQRVSLARALVIEPGLLLLDEPLSALDPKVREALRGEIKSTHDKLKITTIMVTHDQEEAITMGDKLAVMNEGEIVQFGTPIEVYKGPRDYFVADFVGKINFLTDKKNVTWMIRPEDVECYTEAREGTFPGTITNIEFRGPFYRLTVALKRHLILIDLFSKELEKRAFKLHDPVYVRLDRAEGLG
ncbi:MAG: ATP-binding cassette domain-containing protein [Fusobacteriaceae bacterium]|jgi:iron(III) transport system ATP-binding protein|nr:ATP-binding cassette domain-containing protein [Fusobacteriaceae bacterium]